MKRFDQLCSKFKQQNELNKEFINACKRFSSLLIDELDKLIESPTHTFELEDCRKHKFIEMELADYNFAKSGSGLVGDIASMCFDENEFCLFRILITVVNPDNYMQMKALIVPCGVRPTSPESFDLFIGRPGTQFYKNFTWSVNGQNDVVEHIFELCERRLSISPFDHNTRDLKKEIGFI